MLDEIESILMPKMVQQYKEGDGESLQDIANKLGMSKKTVRYRLDRMAEDGEIDSCIRKLNGKVVRLWKPKVNKT